jgi:hypothetical protein
MKATLPQEKQAQRGSSPTRARGFAGSAAAKRLAAGILEGLSGLRGASEAASALGLSLQRYYHLEARGLEGLVQALEPRPKGRRRRPEDEVAALRRESERLRRELQRAQALVRVAQRAVGLPPAAADNKVKKGGGQGRRRRALVRAKQVVDALRRDESNAVLPAVEARA